MALSDNQKIAIVGIGAILLWHFCTGKNDPEATNEQNKSNLSNDYGLLIRRLKGLQNEFHSLEDKCSQDRERFVKREFDSVIERALGLKHQQDADKIYDRVKAVGGKGVLLYHGEGLQDFLAEVDKLVRQCQEFSEESVSVLAESRAKANIVREPPPVAVASVWDSAPIAPHRDVIMEPSNIILPPVPAKVVQILNYTPTVNMAGRNPIHPIDQRMLDSQSHLSQSVEPMLLEAPPVTLAPPVNMDMADGGDMVDKDTESTKLNAIRRDTVPTQPVNTASNDAFNQSPPALDRAVVTKVDVQNDKHVQEKPNPSTNDPELESLDKRSGTFRPVRDVKLIKDKPSNDAVDFNSVPGLLDDNVDPTPNGAQESTIPSILPPPRMPARRVGFPFRALQGRLGVRQPSHSPSPPAPTFLNEGKAKRKRGRDENTEVETDASTPFESAPPARKNPRTQADPQPETKEATQSPSQEAVDKARKIAARMLNLAKTQGGKLMNFADEVRTLRGFPPRWIEGDRAYYISELWKIGNYCQQMRDQLEIAGARLKNQDKIEGMFNSYRELLGPVFMFQEAFKITRGELKLFKTFRGVKRAEPEIPSMPALEDPDNILPPPKKQRTRAEVQAQILGGGNPSTGNEDNAEQPMLDLTGAQTP